MDGQLIAQQRIEHVRGGIAEFLSQFPRGSPVAVETIGNWYWIVEEIERSGQVPRLVHAHKAKLMLGSINKTDKLDVAGLNILQRTGTVPTVWIPPGPLRDRRELPRTRMVLAKQRTQLKNRIHSVFAKYGLQDFHGISDIFGQGGRRLLKGRIKDLPSQTAYTTRCLLRELDEVGVKIERIEKRMTRVFKETQEIGLLMSMPGVGFILAVVIWLEVGDIQRFAGADKLASYAGTTPRVHASGGKVRYGALRTDVNHYLKWAFSEAGNSVAVNHKRRPQRHVSQLYRRIRSRKGHAKAIGAVARHLAEATYWILQKQQPYLERGLSTVSPRRA
jgi:transposase